MDTILYIGVVQAIFTALVLFFKSPINIADNILKGWLFLIAFLLGFALFRRSFPDVSEASWVGDLNTLISFPPFLYLYTKYSIKTREKFKLMELLHFAPVVLSVLVLLVIADWSSKGFVFGYSSLNSNLWLRDLLGVYLIFSLWFYLYRSILLISKYRKEIVNLYSYQSEKNNYIWLQVVIIAFAIIFNGTWVLGAMNEFEYINFNVGTFNKIGIILFVYAVSFWGFRQNQLILTSINEPIEKLTASDRKSSYKKTGLKEENVTQYLTQLKATMETTEIWKNPELSIADLSHETKIPKHYITQLLNEELNKNFYSFVNEYRTEGAKLMLQSPEFGHLSILGIAYECGFNSKSAFNNFFKKYTGTTPSVYKNQKEEG